MAQTRQAPGLYCKLHCPAKFRFHSKIIALFIIINSLHPLSEQPYTQVANGEAGTSCS
jgi:hypothetical protein